jgi:hypothetical protein
MGVWGVGKRDDESEGSSEISGAEDGVEGLGAGMGLCGGPTGTIREPNSTPMVTSWCGEKRPSQRRIVREDFPGGC